MNAEQLAVEIRAMHPNGAIARVDIEGDLVCVHTARPGILIGKRGANLGVLNEQLEAWFGRPMQLQIHEVRKAELEPQLIADIVLVNLQRGVAVERMVKHVQLAEKHDARVRIEISGATGDHVFESEMPFAAGDVADASDGDIHVRVRLLRTDS